jgi:hypothetical protein
MLREDANIQPGGGSTRRRVGAGVIGGRSWRRLVTMLGLRRGSVLALSSGQDGGGGGGARGAAGRPPAAGGTRSGGGNASSEDDSPRSANTPPLQVASLLRCSVALPI